MDTLYIKKIASQVHISEKQVKEVHKLLFEEDATVPFIARYRKERTGGLDDLKIKEIFDQIHYFKELDTRKQTVLDTIKKQDKLSEALEKKIKSIFDKQELEDLYLPYKPKKSSKAAKAKALGLEPLSTNILQQKNINIDLEIKTFLKTGKLKTYEEVETHLLYILAEAIASHPKVLTNTRNYYLQHATIETKLKRGRTEEDAIKYKDYLAIKELVKKIPSHRFLAISRAESEGFISFKFVIDENMVTKKISSIILTEGKRISNILKKALAYTTKEALHTQMSSYLKKTLKERADLDAIDIFKKNLSDILLAPPLPNKVVMGIDPGFRTGAKVAIIDSSGIYKEYANIFAVEPFKKVHEAEHIIHNLVQRYGVEAIAIGNGTASRETTKFIKNTIKNSSIIVSTVNEAGASIYSASETARKEFPNLDVTVRGAISIARRLADPLSELVKIEPKSIGVGQYQHDVNQKQLSESLHFVVSSIVNRIGVDLNTASENLLSYVSGLSQKNVENIIAYRKENQNFKTREEIKKVKGIGPKIYTQAAGFLMLESSKNPLDATRVHPESYSLASKIIALTGFSIEKFFSLTTEKKESLLHALDLQALTEKLHSDMYTLQDILSELIVPLRDPRENFQYANFQDNIQDIQDLSIGITLEGVINNLTKFGAFVDIGLHESGLVHISEISDEFITDINKVLRLGQVVKVKVISIDLKRKRIGLSMKHVE